MAIDRIPGVGPANSDIAATIATTPAVSAQITASVPTAAQIATAVAAPSLAQITTAITTNAAPASVTMAAITSSITTNAASAGVTLAAIGTQVANNASPFGGSWTYLGGSNPTGTNVATISGFSGYKRYRLYATFYATGADYNLYLRINGNSTGIYQHQSIHWRNNSSNALLCTNAMNDNQISLAGVSGVGVYNGFMYGAVFDFEQSNSSQWKTVSWTGGYYLATYSVNASTQGTGFIRDTAQITSISITNPTINFSTTTGTGMYLYGGN